MLTSAPKWMLFCLAIIMASSCNGNTVSAATLLRGGNDIGAVAEGESNQKERQLQTCVNRSQKFYIKIEGRYLKMDQAGANADYRVISRGDQGNSPTKWEVKNGGLFNVGRSRYARVLGDNVKGRQDRSNWDVTFHNQNGNCNTVKIELTRNGDVHWLKHNGSNNIKAVDSGDAEVFELITA